MSIAAMNWAFEQRIAGNDKLVLLALADNADADGSCFPAHEVIALKASISERTVRDVLNRLREADYIHWERRNSPATGYRSSNRYFLHLPGLPADVAGRPTGRSASPTGNLLPFEEVNPQIEPSVSSSSTKRQKATKLAEGPLTDEEIEVAFEQFWQTTPRRVGKGAARRAYRSALAKASRQVLLTGINAYRQAVQRDQREIQFVKHPASWLNGEHWADDHGPAAGTGRDSIRSL